MAKRKPVPPLTGSSKGTFPAAPQRGAPLGRKDYGYWVGQGGSHFLSMGKEHTVTEPKTHHEHRSASWARKR